MAKKKTTKEDRLKQQVGDLEYLLGEAQKEIEILMCESADLTSQVEGLLEQLQRVGEENGRCLMALRLLHQYDDNDDWAFDRETVCDFSRAIAGRE